MGHVVMTTFMSGINRIDRNKAERPGPPPAYYALGILQWKAAMEDTDESLVEGGCLCGAVRFTVEPPTLFCGHCHCTMCQRSHGAAFVTWFGVSRDRLSIETGSDQLVVSQSSDHGTRSFCGRCGTSLFCDSDSHPDSTDVVLAVMTGAIDRAPQAHVYYDSHVDWVSIHDDLPRLGGDSGIEEMKSD